jgi:predicted RNA binding protein YcfA (HicA-like mRNA interferase family)
MRVKEIIKIIEQDGWFMVRIKGSYRQYKHQDKKGVVTIAGNLNDELAKGDLPPIIVPPPELES